MSYSRTAQAYSGFGTVRVSTQRVADTTSSTSRAAAETDEPISGGDDISLPPDYRRLPDDVRDPIPSQTAIALTPATIIRVAMPGGGSAAVVTQPVGTTRIPGLRAPSLVLKPEPTGACPPGFIQMTAATGETKCMPSTIGAKWPSEAKPAGGSTDVITDTERTGTGWWSRRSKGERVAIGVGGAVLAVLLLRGALK